MVPHRDWEQLHDVRWPSVKQNYENSPTAEYARELLELAVTCMSDQQKKPMLQSVIDEQSDNPDTLRLAAAVAYNRCVDELALDALSASLALSHDKQTLLQLIEVLIQTNQIEEAQAHTDELVSQQAEEAGALLIQLTDAYTRLGDAQAALDQLDRHEQLYPERARQFRKSIRQRRKRLEKSLRSGRAPKQVKIRAPGSRKRSFIYRAFLLVVAAVFVLLFVIPLLIFGVAALLDNTTDKVYVVSGISEPYKVMIDTQTVMLRPNRTPKIKLTYGEVAVEPVPGDFQFPATRINLNTTFWDRVLGRNTYVINPDQMALVTHENAAYSIRPKLGEGYEYEIHTPATLHHLTGIDYPMRELPDEMDIPSDQSVVWKSACNIIRNVQLGEKLSFLHDEYGMETTAEYLERAATYTPNEPHVPSFTLGLLGEDEFLRLAQTHLEARPVLVEWHRAYQTYIESTQPEVDLVAEYRQRHEAEPDNPDLIYLYARTINDHEHAAQRVERGLARHPDHPYLNHARAFRLKLMGYFASALEANDRSTRAMPNNSTFANLAYDLKLACGHYEQLIAETEARLYENDYDFDLTRQHVALLAASGQEREAERVIARFQRDLRRLNPEIEPETATTLTNELTLAMHEARGDLDAYAELSHASEDENYAYVNALIDRDWDTALNLLEQGIVEDSAFERLLLFVLMRDAGQNERAESQLNRAKVFMRDAGSDGQELADLLESSVRLPNGVELRVTFGYERLQLTYLALAQTHPRQAEWLRKQAHKHSYMNDFTSMILSSLD
ncbi:hypothetical protein [Mucisphaera calidilacus]|nr:hypothetical protein [Mucisphaera calidilacus]